MGKAVLLLNSNEEKIETFIYNLKHLRNLKKLTQQEIANFLHIERSTYTKYETGDATPSIYLLNELANFYNCSMDDFFK